MGASSQPVGESVAREDKVRVGGIRDPCRKVRGATDGGLSREALSLGMKDMGLRLFVDVVGWKVCCV
jgi:hypothetical protein